MIKREKPPEFPMVGMGATLQLYTDRKAATIIKVGRTKRTFTMQLDRAIRTDENGMDESQTYRYEPDPNGEIFNVYCDQNGRWRVSKKNYLTVGIGYRRAYHDFSF